MKPQLFLLLVLILAPPAVAQISGELDLLSLAGLLIRDGNYEKAQATLNQIDLSDRKTDKVRFYSLSGLLLLRQEKYADAEGVFTRGVEAAPQEGSLWASLAQAQFAQEKYEDTLKTIEKVPRIRAFPDLLGVKSQALWNLGRREESYRVLADAAEAYPGRLTFLHQQIVTLLNLGLTQEALALGREYRYRGAKDPAIYVTLGEVFRRGKDLTGALEVLETGRQAFPAHTKIKIALAQVYLEKGLPRTAAGLIEEASAYYAPLMLEAAELHRRAGQYNRALYLNSLVSDLPQKTRQRFNLLVDSGRFEESAALLPRLEREGLLRDEGLRYAAAYVAFQTQRLDLAKTYLAGISSSDLFSQALALRRALESLSTQDILLFQERL